MILRAEDMFGPADDPFDALVPGSGMDRTIVVWIDVGTDLIAVLDLGGDGWPTLDKLSHVEERIERQGLILESAERLAPAWLEREIDEGQRAKRDAKMAVIAPILKDCPKVFDRNARGRMVAQAMRSSGRSRNSIKAWLLRYYANGRCGNALIDNYEAVGKGRRRSDGLHWKKLGHPSAKPDKPSQNVTPQLREEFAIATKRERKFAGEAFRIFKAHERWKTEFCHSTKEIDGRFVTRLHDRHLHEAPANYGQFLYWYKNDGGHEKTGRVVLGDAIYDKDNRAITSTSTNETWGPASRFQIDATVVNFEVTSKVNKNVLIGRPYLYFVRDVWSRMIVGYYLGFQPPSQITASLALLSAFSSKDAVLREFGFDPEVDRWLSNCVCGALLHDGGELTGHWGDWLIGRLRMTFEQTSCDRADLKGAVESIFHWSDVEWSSKIKGHVNPLRYIAKQKRNANLDAAARGELSTIWEFEKKVIKFILDFNNNHTLVGYDQDADMFAAGIPRVPAEMFEWGIENRGAPRRFDDEQVRFHMMPRAMVSVYADGIHFQKSVFTCPDLRPLQAEASRTERVRRVLISYDLSGDSVFWHRGKSVDSFIECGLADSQRAKRGLRTEDAAALEEARRVEEQARREEEDRVKAEVAADDARKRGEARKVAKLPTGTIAQQKAAGAKQRAAERTAERQGSFADKQPRPTLDGAGASNVIPFHVAPKAEPPKVDYSTPELDEIDDD